MELQEFIEKSLVQIIRGVEKAQQTLADSNATINPKMSKVFVEGGNPGLGYTKGSALATMVQFDIAVTAEKGHGTKGGIGVVTGFISLGSQGSSEKSHSAATRIQFSVPISLPSKSDGLSMTK